MALRHITTIIIAALAYGTACAQQFSCNERERAACMGHEEQIAGAAMFRAAEEIERLYYNFNVPDSIRGQVERLVRTREFRKTCQEILHKDSAYLRARNKDALDELYLDSINRLIIPYNIYNISGENVSALLRLPGRLRIDESTRSGLLEKAVDMARRIRCDRMLNVWDEEMELLKKKLSTKQYNLFFSIKNRRTVDAELRDAWDRIVEAGLESQLDSAKDVALAHSYLNERQKLKTIYRYRPVAQKKQLDEQRKHRPLMIRMLDALDKKEALNNDEEKKKAIAKEFVW